ncbi:SLC13 family permease [Desulfosudis oleivorans]|uniref:Anion transporter n=1 Tax=Desulfosudis oleivorans (strain DSM 6200 / JCM 39069 / Hxd3) TaxID=96561 RepID=A8ZYQ8_DESOH|nr:DASS family sodium-coupled anion symporter [Desulfosudis oleivorans]ABW67163.1 anion transporter [Desulfosudis oleivorans Hxd3]
MSFFKSNIFKLCIALSMGVIVLVLPRPEGTRFKISGDPDQRVLQSVESAFTLVAEKSSKTAYVVEARNPGTPEATAGFLRAAVDGLAVAGVADAEAPAMTVDYVDGLSPKAKRFLAMLAVLVFLFIVEPVPLEITAICIGVFLVIAGVSDVKDAWAPYMHPVVLFIMCCLIFAISLDKAGITRRMGYFIIKRAGTSVTKFTFIIATGLGLASGVMHDAAACAIGIVTMIPMMKAAGIEPHSNTAKFMMISLPFACSAGGMSTLIGGGRCMVSAAFLKEYTGIEITFFEWIKYCLPAGIITVPIAVLIVYFVFRPNPKYKLPQLEKAIGPLTPLEIKTLVIIGLTFATWLTKGLHGIDYSITGMLGVSALVVAGILKWEDIHENLEWGTALFIFGGGISLGLAMGYSGAADYFANLFFPLVEGKGWFVLFAGVAVFGALVTNVMANVAAAALILPIVIPMALMEGVDPTVLALCLGTATSFALLLVIGCPPNAIAYSYRYFKSSDLTKVGLVATPILLAALILVAATWWKILGLV